MAEQFGLPGFEAEAKPTDRLFFGLYPPAPVAERIAVLAARLKVQHGLKSRPHQTDRLHITLHLIGDFAGLPKDRVEKARAAAGALRVAPFEVVLDRALSFSKQPRNGPFTLQGAGEGVAPLIALREALSLELMKAGLPKVANTSFTPHVTLLYDDQAVAEQPVEPISWTVTELVLVHSLLGRTEHRKLDSWRLDGG